MYISEQHIPITLDNFLDFIHKYLEDNFGDTVKNLNIIIHIKNEKRIEEMRHLLVLEDIWVIRIQELQLEKDNNKEFQEYLEKYRLYESNDIFTHITKTSLFNRLISKLWFPEKIGIKDFKKIKENKEKKPYIKTDSFSSIAMYREWEEFKSTVPQFTSFTAKIQVLPTFFYQALHSLIYKEIDASISKVVTKLYDNISSEIWGKRNSDKEVIIFYPMEKYIENMSSIYPILYSLEEKGILRVSKQEIKDWKIYFTLADINNFTLEECRKSFKKIQWWLSDEIVFKNNDVYINNEVLKFKWKNTKTFKVVKAYFELSLELQKREVVFSEIEESHKLVKEIKKYNYDSFNDVFKDLNERVKNEHSIDEFIRVTKSSLICEYLKV